MHGGCLDYRPKPDSDIRTVLYAMPHNSIVRLLYIVRRFHYHRNACKASDKDIDTAFQNPQMAAQCCLE